MLQGRRVAVVIPAYNEAPRIARVLSTVPTYVDLIVVVDDASEDRTVQAVTGCIDERVALVQHPDNRGVGAALDTGYQVAFDNGMDVAAVMAGDGQMHPDDLHRLVLPVLHNEAEYCKGNRLNYPGVRSQMPPQRWLGNHVLSWATRLVTGLAVTDSQCGFTALSREAHRALPWGKLWRGYGYPNDLLGWLAIDGARVQDVVVRPIYADEVSGIGWRHALLVIPFLLLRIVIRRVSRRAVTPETGRPCASDS